MPRPHTLKISEIFSSIQGEGLRQGEPTLFIRLAGCNLRCDFCDTKYAWDQGRDMLIKDILARARKERLRFPAEWVCLTGGEPLLQNISFLIQELKKDGYKIQVETNAVFDQILPVDWYTISPKPETYFFHPSYPSKAREIKLVVTKGLNLEIVRDLRKKFPEKIPILLQPQSNRVWSMKQGLKIIKEAASGDLKNIRLSVQLHKIFGLK